MVAILVGVVAVPTAGAPVALAELERRVPFDSNGQDNSFAVAMSRPQGPLIGGAEELELQSRSRVAAADIPDTGDPVRGSFGAQVAWPIMPIHAVLMPDGRVLTYGTDRNGVQTAYYDYDVWNPAFGTGPEAHNTLVNGTQTDIFCSSQIVLLNGDVEMYGGDNLPASTNTQNRDVNQYLPASNTLVRTGSMHRLRWYSTAINLPNGEVYIQGGSGGADFPEVRDNNGQFRLLTGASTGSLSSGYPRNFVAPDGLVFSLANSAMRRINPAGTGTITSLPTFPTDNTGGSSTAVMFAPGRILQVGGGPSSAASRNASVININGSTPQVTALPQTQFGRHWGNATVMADGRVLVSGGSAVNNAATGVAYTTEIFNPAGTGTWSTGPTATRMRLYHSTSLLLPDASVITMGGGTPGPETNLNAEIYFPPYLFNGDGTRATRPTIGAATAVTDPATSLTIESPDAASITRVTLVKVGSVTHSFDMDQRFMELPFTKAGTTLQATLPANVHETPPGYYMVFVHAAGVPSEAAFVKINVAPTAPPPPPTTTTTTTTTTTLPPTTTSTTTTTTTPPTTTSTTTSTTTTTTPATTSTTTTTTPATVDDDDHTRDDDHDVTTGASAASQPRGQWRVRDQPCRSGIGRQRQQLAGLDQPDRCHQGVAELLGDGGRRRLVEHRA